ncbi:hypothetical protein M8J75_015421 [Diaphorina citri]|nr:hypothetical protein M8J75_015421 [Diaphorina citri]
MTFSDIDEHQEENDHDSDNRSDISWKSDDYAAMIEKTSGEGKKHRVVFEDEIGHGGRRGEMRPKSACSVHQEKEGKVSRLYSLTRGQCRTITRCHSALGLRRHDGKLSRSPCPMQDFNEDAEKKYNIVNFKRSLKLLGFDPEEFGIEANSGATKPRTKNVKPMTITRLERRTVSLDDVKKAVLNEFENDLRFRKFQWA